MDASENSAHNRQQQQQQQQPDLLLRIYHSRRHRAAGYVAPRQAAVTSSGRGAASAGKRRREDTNASTDDGEGEGSPSKRSRITSAASKKPTVSVGTCTSEDAEAMSSDVVLLQSRLDDVTAEAAATVEMNEAVLTQVRERRMSDLMLLVRLLSSLIIKSRHSHCRQCILFYSPPLFLSSSLPRSCPSCAPSSTPACWRRSRRTRRSWRPCGRSTP